MINKDKFKAKVVEQGLTQKELSKTIGISNNSLSRKLNNKAPFTLGELQAIKDKLELTSQEVSDIFFVK